MNADDDLTNKPGAKEFEHHARGVLEATVTRVNARVRSRLNQARHAALEEIAARPPSFWRRPALMPATGAVAAAMLVALILTTRQGGERALPVSDGGQTAYEDIEMLADTEGLDLIEGWDSGFYEWAAAQSEDADRTSG
jgi:hypothetical protein